MYITIINNETSFKILFIISKNGYKIPKEFRKIKVFLQTCRLGIYEDNDREVGINKVWRIFLSNLEISFKKENAMAEVNL